MCKEAIGRYNVDYFYLNNAERFHSVLVAQKMPEIGNSPMRCAVATVAIGMSK